MPAEAILMPTARIACHCVPFSRESANWVEWMSKAKSYVRTAWVVDSVKNEVVLKCFSIKVAWCQWGMRRCTEVYLLGGMHCATRVGIIK